MVHKLWVRKVPGNQTADIQRRSEKYKKKVLKMLIAVVISPYVKESKQVVDSEFHNVDYGFRGLDSGFHVYGFRIPNVFRFWIHKFLTLVFIGSSEANILQFEYEVVNLNGKFICSPKGQNVFKFPKACVNANASL